MITELFRIGNGGETSFDVDEKSFKRSERIVYKKMEVDLLNIVELKNALLS